MARPFPIGAFSPGLTLLALVLLVSPAAALGVPGRVVTKDGKTWEGDVTERNDAKQVDVVVEGRKYTFSRDNVDRVELDDAPPAQPPAGQGRPQPGGAMTAEQEFDKRRAALAPGDVAGRVKLARMAFDREEYDIARDIAQEALQIDRRNQEAQDLLRTIDAQRKLNRRTPPGGQQRPQGQAPAGQDPKDMENPPVGRGQAGSQGGGNSLVPPLSPDEVNRVRVLEWRGEPGVRVRLINDVKRRYLARSHARPAEFNKLNAMDQAWEIRQKGTDEMLNDVRLTNDPPSMHEYRTLIQRAVLTGCATAACHGGGQGGNFALHPKADREGEAYANFLTLHKYTYKPEKGREASMIDRNRPEDSLLIQFGLPQDVANMPHPQVGGFKPMFRTLQDPRYQQFVRWIADSLSPLQEDYGVPFGQQGGGQERPAAARQPADQPRGEVQPADAAPPAGQPGQQGDQAGSLPGGRAPGGDRPAPAPPRRPGQ